MSRFLSSRKLVIVEDKDQTILQAIDKATGSKLYSRSSNAYVKPAKGVSNFRALANLGRVLQQIVGKKIDLIFIQDRDGLPDFMVEPFLKSQNTQGVRGELLHRHKIESYLLEPDLISKAAKAGGYALEPSEAEDAILKASKELKATALRLSVNTAKAINKFLESGDKYQETDIEEKVYKWFDELDADSLDVVKTHYPGKELIGETLKLLEKEKEIKLTRGKIVATIEAGLVAKEIVDLIERVAS